ncbi:MAG: hypothetical protein HC772_06680 [Leptolyngbyaceae cyanobacterium CRU_2_3]|nr:hypothetical protein [Leptolyngbyaceae cyanobacterium CRU_2_3]
MTPTAIRIVSQLRQEFYSRFATAMQIPVNITSENSYTSNLSKASWLDSTQQLNYVCIYAHTAPDALVAERPLILRLAVNRGADLAVSTRQGKSSHGLNRNLHFELTLLPEEVLDFLPWIVSLVKSHDTGSSSFGLEPPYPLDFKTSHALSFQNAWTQKASSTLAKQLLPSQEYVPCLNTSQGKLLG